MGRKGRESESTVGGCVASHFCKFTFPSKKYHWHLTGVRRTVFLRNGFKFCLHNTEAVLTFNSKDDNNNNNGRGLFGGETAGVLLDAALETMKATIIPLYM